MDRNNQTENAHADRTTGQDIQANQQEVTTPRTSQNKYSWPHFGSMRKRITQKIPELKRGPVLALSVALGAVGILALVGYLIVTRAKAPDVQTTNKPAVSAQHPSTPSANNHGVSELFGGGQPSAEQEPANW